jgi:hypothetical protein
MKSRYRSLVFFVCGALLINFSCKTIQIRTEADVDHSIESLKRNYAANRGEFKSFSVSRMSVTILNNSTETSLRGSLRLVRDSAMIVSLNAGLGLELARAFLTHDNIQIIDRINSDYSKLSYSQIRSILGIDADYLKVEKLLLNSFAFPDLFKLHDYEISADNEYVVLYDKGNRIIEGFDEAKVYFRKKDLLISRMDLFDNQTRHFASIEYTDFYTYEKGVVIPQQIRIFVNRGGETIELLIRYLKAEINSVRGITFTVPPRYL